MARVARLRGLEDCLKEGVSTLHSFSFDTPFNCASIEHFDIPSHCSPWATLALLSKRLWLVRYRNGKRFHLPHCFPFELLNITTECLPEPLLSSLDSETWSTNIFVLLFFVLFFV